ncbi:hypothetical protein EJB05_44670, partial [Eragrostis curvula]
MAAAAPPPRVMVLPFPAQGHVMPLMALAHLLVQHGIEVEFVNTDFNRDRIIKAGGGEAVPAGINMVSFPDGMGPEGDHAATSASWPARRCSARSRRCVSKKIRWVVADVAMSWVVTVTAGCGVPIALFSLISVGAFVLRMHAPNLIEDGIIHEIGKRHIHAISNAHSTLVEI